jgi:predicted TIM-barrel fold metal-dependent hydrolase
LKAVALVPSQDPVGAARELNRAVKELGMVGGVLQAVGMSRPYGDRAFDPLYEEAEKLDTMLAIHGASQGGLGLDFIESPRPKFILEHTLAQEIQFTSMICDRVFDRYPHLKVAFLEADCGWAPYLIERIDRKAGGIASEQVRNHPVYFHAELMERALPYAISEIGDDRFLYATDFPHEPVAEIEESLEHFLAREDLSQTSKQRILCDNIKAIYSMT